MTNKILITAVKNSYGRQIFNHNHNPEDYRIPNIERVVRDFELTGEKGNIIRNYLRGFKEISDSEEEKFLKRKKANKDYLSVVPLMSSALLGSLAGWVTYKIFDSTDLTSYIICGGIAGAIIENSFKPLKKKFINYLCNDIYEESNQKLEDLESKIIDQLASLPKD